MPTHSERRHHIDLGGLTPEPDPEPEPKRLRVTLELNRSDDPMLFDALIVLGKGRRRVARLRTLAHDGLMIDPTARTATQPVGAEEAGQGRAGHGQPAHRLPGDEQSSLAPLSPDVTAGIFEVPDSE